MPYQPPYQRPSHTPPYTPQGASSPLEGALRPGFRPQKTAAARHGGAAGDMLRRVGGMTDATMIARLDLIEALLFELLRQATPTEASPFVAERLAAAVPRVEAAKIAARLTRPATDHLGTPPRIAEGQRA